MQKSKALSSLRNIFPPIHQPLPMNKNDTQRLLDAIKASFRTQLDEEHGWTVPDRIKTLSPTNSDITYLPSPADPLAANQIQSRSRLAPAAGSPALQQQRHGTRPTDRHIHAIVNNPLFSAGESTKISTTSAAPWEAHKAIFEKAVARGLMTIPRAQGFLMLVKYEVKKSKYLRLGDGLKETGAGLLVLQWLRSSGQERSLEFLSNQAFKRLLLQFVVAEGLEDVAWGWFERLLKQERISGEAFKHEAASASLLGSLVQARVAGLMELEGAYATLMRAETIVKENHAIPDVLYLAWTSLAWETTLNSSHRPKPPVDLFNSFVALGQTIQSRPLDRAHINLHHPLSPSAKRAVEFLTGQDAFARLPANARQMAWKENWVRKASKVERYVHHLRFLGIDTIHHLLQANENEEASRLWELLDKHVGFILPPKLIA
ncbi:hypothetical protein NEMBOFW57_007121 [Staphylotrichum longicolle]|uniref:Uncharacterized protein n=1 Tax=Staphylotrichum longicolle TaxID=669026 RepID=A0AAD4EU82_9PEZI|nr:hypothetical protein NEMBOFW57_007121 [Staphylotrichum longicolle]